MNPGLTLEPVFLSPYSMVSAPKHHAHPKVGVQAYFETTWENMGWGFGRSKGKTPSVEEPMVCWYHALPFTKVYPVVYWTNFY